MFIRDCMRLKTLMSSSGHASLLQRNSSSVNMPRWGRSASTLLAASLLLGVSGVAVRAADDSSKADQATNQALMRKLQALERRMQTLEAELKQKQAPAGGPRSIVPVNSNAPGKPNNSFAKAQAGAVADATKNKDLFGVGASPIPGLKIGMYGEIKFGTQQNAGANGQWQSGFDMARLVLLPTYQVTDNIVFNAEIEFEHAGSAFDNDDKLHGAAEIEQAFFDLRFNDYFTLRSPGVDLVPISFNNLYHEPTLFYSVQRPELANGLIPTTWVAGSAGLYG